MFESTVAPAKAPTAPGSTHLVDAIVGDVRVLVPEVENGGAADLVDHAQHVGHARAVVTDAHGRLEVGGNRPRQRAAQAEAEYRGCLLDAGLRAEVGECRTEVADGGGKIELAHLLQAGGESFDVVAGFPAGAEAPEHVGRPDQVARLGQALADRSDVRPDAEDLLDEHDGRSWR